jgi:hypothetical protein
MMKREGNTTAINVSVTAMATALAPENKTVSLNGGNQLPDSHRPKLGIVKGHTITATAG